MAMQVITVRPDGSIFGLQHKRGRGIDLRAFGPAKIERATLIEWEEKHQAWFIRWTEEAGMDIPLWDSETFNNVMVGWERFNGRVCPEYIEGCWTSEVILFHDYEDAVAAEIAVIQAMQLAGDLA